MLKNISTCCPIVFIVSIAIYGTLGFHLNSAIATTAIVYVDNTAGSASPAGLGDAWGANHAYKYLHDGLSRAHDLLGSSADVEVWIADGTYKTDQSNASPSGTGWQTTTFAMERNVRWYGGFVGNETGAGAFLSRNPVTNVTTLSGDINNSSDTYHVVTANRINATGIIDGFNITRGDARGSPDPETGIPGGGGGGMLLIGTGESTSGDEVLPVILRCRFTNNQADDGGAVWLQGGEENQPLFYNCRFDNNTADGNGGAFYSHDRGGMVAESVGASPSFANCIFDHNTATNGTGGAIYSEALTAVFVKNCTIVQNTAGTSQTSGLHHASVCSDPHDEGLFVIHNTIIASNSGSPELHGASQIYDSRVANLSWVCSGTGNTTSDPQFVDLTNGNYRLACGSPCINAASETGFPGDVYDIDQDALTSGPMPDFDLQYRVVGEATNSFKLDMGAYETQPVATCNVADIVPSPCRNYAVDIDDLLAIITHWNACPALPASCPWDIANADGVVDIDDLLAVITNWGACPGHDAIDDFPTSVQGCMNRCSNNFDPESELWAECVNDCVQALCEAHIIDCD